PGQTATITVDALSGARFEATVARISPVVDPATGTFKITIEVTDASRRLKPGMFGRINIVHDRHANALQVPRGAVVEDGGAETVFVVEDGVAHRRAIVTGYAQEGYVEVTEGLMDGEQVVTVGQAGLKEGAKVAVINATSNEAAANNAVATD
ncbi:MAG: efflux RND transporter periplasmic adaptor subunit, partial [Woeseiaceae bacterium]